MIQNLSGSDLGSKALEADTPVALDFFQASCAPCHALEPRLACVAQAYVDRLTVYRVDVDRDLPVAERFGVMSLPTVLILKGGREVERLDGLIREDDLRAAFERVTQ